MLRDRLWCLAVIASLGCAPASSDWEPAEPGQIFRFTTIGVRPPFDSVVLDEPWPTAAKYGAKPGDTLTALPPGTFAGSDAIRVRRTREGIVTQMEFDYSARRDAMSLLMNYGGSLGRPAEELIDSVEHTTRTRTVWRDARTEFTLFMYAPPLRGQIAATAILTNRPDSSAAPRDTAASPRPR